MRFFEPIDVEVRLARDATVVNLEKPLDRFVAQSVAHEPDAEKRRIADDELRFRPFGFDVAHLLPLPA
ncbi:MAG: hypothetical protein ABSC37_09505, partial [Xanthobacteraceae bacterium]